ncbi:MAG: putative HTH transcriptional regulator [Flavobacteriaceae bacterium]|jgi:predicted HTH transcriptional regulator
MSDLQDRIRRGEGLQLDFKFRIDDQKKIARTLVAFANAQGGSLLIGVKDSGKVTGVNPEEEYYMVEGAADLHTKPRVSFETKVWQEKHHLVLEVVVEKAKVKHQAIDEEGKWKSFVRVDDHTLVGNKILEKVWHFETHGVNRPEKFDDTTLDFIRLIKIEQPVTISGLYRKSNLAMKKVDSLVSVLVFWRVIEMKMTELATAYCLSE